MIFNIDLSNIKIATESDYWNNNINNCCISNLEKKEISEDSISKLKNQIIVFKN